ncbi:MAG: ABC transporter permease [Clostridia bacterium]|nr:ABC transporter permease [Clostridia bacterium]
MKAIGTIIKKEFMRFFKDLRLVLTVILLPGFMIFAMYSLMGSIMDKMTEDALNYQPVAYVVNLPDDVPEFAYFSTFFDVKEAPDDEKAKQDIIDEKADIYVIFKPQSSSSGESNNLDIEYFYNDASTHSQTAFMKLSSMLSAYQSRMSIITVNGNNLAEEGDLGKSIISMIAPMILLMLLFSGCMAVAPESIAGEKERGTMATLLVTPVKRSSIAIGKIIALSCIALLSGLSSTVGLVVSLPKLAGGAGAGISLAMYGVGEYMAILGVVLSTVLILVSLISIISANAKSVKEASGLVVPVMLIVMLCGVFSMFVTGASLGFYFIPVFNSALLISSVLSGAISGGAIAATICTNVAFSGLLVFLLTLMFKSERVMFNK